MKRWNITETDHGQIMRKPGIKFELDERTGVSITMVEPGTKLLTWEEMQDLMRGIIRSKRKGPGCDNSRV